MWAVYLCGSADCFLHAMFDTYGSVEEYALSLPKNPEGFFIKEFKTINDIPKEDWPD